MEATIGFWNALTSFVGAMTIILVFYFMSKIFKNMFEAYKKHHYVTNHYHYKLTNCTLIEPEDLR